MPGNLGHHVAKLTGCEPVGDDRLQWTLELLYPEGPACERPWGFITGKVWQPLNTNRLCMLLSAFGIEDAAAARRADPKQLYGRELVVQIDATAIVETGEVRRMVAWVMPFKREQWEKYLAWKAQGRR